MQKNLKTAAASAAALAILVAGGLAIALPAQAASVDTPAPVVEPVAGTDADNVQDEVQDGAADAETNDGTGDSGTEDTSDDVGGVAVEDGTQD